MEMEKSGKEGIPMDRGDTGPWAEGGRGFLVLHDSKYLFMKPIGTKIKMILRAAWFQGKEKTVYGKLQRFEVPW